MRLLTLVLLIAASNWYTYRETMRVTRIVTPPQVAADAASYRLVSEIERQVPKGMIPEDMNIRMAAVVPKEYK